MRHLVRRLILNFVINHVRAEFRVCQHGFKVIGIFSDRLRADFRKSLDERLTQPIHKGRICDQTAVIFATQHQCAHWTILDCLAQHFTFPFRRFRIGALRHPRDNRDQPALAQRTRVDMNHPARPQNGLHARLFQMVRQRPCKQLRAETIKKLHIPI